MIRNVKYLFLVLVVCSPLLAQREAVKTVETTVMQAPVIGQITTLKTSYFADCHILEVREMKFHNLFATLFSENRKVVEGTLTDYCNERVHELDYDNAEYRTKTFAKVRAEYEADDAEIVIDPDGDPPLVTRTIEREKELVNGFRARKVTTLIRQEPDDRPLIVEEWYTRKLPGGDERQEIRQTVDRALGREKDVYHGVPDFIDEFFTAMEESGQSVEDVPGHIVRAEVRLEDEDGDPIFFLRYNLEKIAEIEPAPARFEIPASLSRVD